MNNELIQKIELTGSNKKITTNKHKYFIKKQKHYNQEKIYTRLEERGFHNFLKPYQILEAREEVFPYLEEKSYLPEEKAIDMMHVLSLLQNKTTFYKEYSLDDIKKIYEDIKSQITYLFSYYQDLEEHFLKEVYPSPWVYLFQRNISLIFSSLFFSEEMLEKWYQTINTKKDYRIVLVHHKFCLEHLLEVEEPLLISLDQVSEGLPIEDILYFLKKHALDQDISYLFKIYQQKYPFTEDEFYLFSSLLALPPKIEFKNENYESLVSLTKTFQKMNHLRLFLLKQDEKKQKHGT